jgi:LuxR family transcriptional regulator, maltose regulon positive regulatory protein
VVLVHSGSGVPASAPHELRRERLLELLHRHRSRPLIVLVAPAGFGKTTLAATYARDSGAAVAWVTLQGADHDSRRLFARLADALEAAFDEPQLLGELRRGLRAGAQGAGLARLLLADLTHAPAGFILVLDDFHVVDGADEVLAAVDSLVRDLPETGQVVITAREPPALSMTRLVARGDVFPLGTEDLRFTPDETRALRAALGGNASRDDHAEGWVAGILLGGAPRQLGVGGGSLLGVYVEREVLARLKPVEQGWLEMLSVLDVITPSMAERILGPGSWPARLLSLTERCPFLVAREDGSYRLHALIRETLLNRLRRSDDGRATYAWSAVRDAALEAFDTVSVVRACEELGQIEGAIEIVRRTAAEALQTGRWSVLLDTAALLPESVRRSDPELSLMEARALENTARHGEAKLAAEAALQHSGRTGDEFVQISALIELANATTFAGELAAAEDWLGAANHLLRNCALTGERRRLLEARAFAIGGVAAAFRGELAEARDALSSAERLLLPAGASRDLAVVQMNYGTLCVRLGDYATAQQSLAMAATHWRVVGDRNGLGVTQLSFADLNVRMGNLVVAGTCLADALEAARAVGAVRLEAVITFTFGQWHRASGRIMDAVSACDAGIRLAEDAVEREALVEALIGRAEIALLQEDLATARELLARAQAEGQRLGSQTALASIDRALGRLHLLDGAGERAVHHLQAALDRGSNANVGPDAQIETLYWLGTAYLGLARPQQASGMLEHAVRLTEEANLPSLLARPAAEDTRLLDYGREVGLNPVRLAEVERIASTRRPWTGVQKRTQLAVVSTNQLPRLDVQLFGPFVLHVNGELVHKGKRKMDRARELLAVLVLHPNGVADETIAEMMWPNMPTERALHNLQMAVHSLRHDLGNGATVRYSAHIYQLNPQLELVADVRQFDAFVARARGASDDVRAQALSKAVELYRDPLLADAGWQWLDQVRTEYRSRYVLAALQLADLLARTDASRSDGLAEAVLAIAPDSESAYERLMQNARIRKDALAVRRVAERYEQAAPQFGFLPNRYGRGRRA